MKIRRVDEKGKVEYPSFDDYQRGRRHFLTTIAAGLGLAALSGCAPNEEPIPPKSGVHQPPTPGNQPEILGKMIAPTPPEPKTPEKPTPTPSRGVMRAPRKPVALEGDMAIAEPPAKAPDKKK
jgi:hypothetical protein